MGKKGPKLGGGGGAGKGRRAGKAEELPTNDAANPSKPEDQRSWKERLAGGLRHIAELPVVGAAPGKDCGKSPADGGGPTAGDGGDAAGPKAQVAAG